MVRNDSNGESEGVQVIAPRARDHLVLRRLPTSRLHGAAERDTFKRRSATRHDVERITPGLVIHVRPTGDVLLTALVAAQEPVAGIGLL